MQARLYFLIAWLAATVGLAQGTFTYTFSGDDSPWNVWATFQASSNAVATGHLSTGNIISGYLLQGGHQWTLMSLGFPVDSYGIPNGTPANTQLSVVYNYDEIDIIGGIPSIQFTAIDYYPRVGTPQQYRSTGSWNVTYNVPEPNTTSLLVIGAALLRLARPRARA